MSTKEFIRMTSIFMSNNGQKVWGYGVHNYAKEDVNDDESTPCITITTMPKKGAKEDTDISLLLGSWAQLDMISIKKGKDNSFEKLGMYISNFSNV